jgi:hypothetical protein
MDEGHPQERLKKMTNYKGYTIEKLARRGVYQIIDPSNNVLATLPLLSDCKKIIDRKAA